MAAHHLTDAAWFAPGCCRGFRVLGEVNIFEFLSSYLWLTLTLLVVLACLAEMGLERLLGFVFKPIEQRCRQLPRKLQIGLMALLLATAVGAWFYGCTRPGF